MHHAHTRVHVSHVYIYIYMYIHILCYDTAFALASGEEVDIRTDSPCYTILQYTIL